MDYSYFIGGKSFIKLILLSFWYQNKGENMVNKLSIVVWQIKSKLISQVMPQNAISLKSYCQISSLSTHWFLLDMTFFYEPGYIWFNQADLGAFKAATSFRFMLFHCWLWLFLLQLRRHPSHLWPISHRAHGTDRYLHAAHCLAATLLTSKTGSPSCLLGNGGTGAGSLCCFAMVNYDCGLKHLLIPPDTRAEGGWSAEVTSCTAHCPVPLHRITCLYETGALCTPVQGYTCWYIQCMYNEKLR